MKVVSINEISRCISRSKELLTSQVYSLYGRGTDTVEITSTSVNPGDTLVSFCNQKYGKLVLEFGNLLIGDGVNLPVIPAPSEGSHSPQIAYLKVSGTLTVNGHLHMDGRGGGFIGNTGTISQEIDDVSGEPIPVYSNNFSDSVFDKYTLNTVSGNSSCSTRLWYDLTNYGSQETFFNGKVSLTGAGGSGYTNFKYTYQRKEEIEPKIDPYQSKYGYWWGDRWIWRDYNQYLEDVEANSHMVDYDVYESRGAKSLSCLSGGGNYKQVSKPTDGNFSCGGGGGGLIALYSETLDNFGPVFSEDGIDYPLNIHANGGRSQNSSSASIYGGGMMVIAARHIVIGPNGSITCDGGDGNGIMTLLGRDPNKNTMIYNNGTPTVYTNTLSGGGGYAQHFIK